MVGMGSSVEVEVRRTAGGGIVKVDWCGGCGGGGDCDEVCVAAAGAGAAKVVMTVCHCAEGVKVNAGCLLVGTDDYS